MPPIRTKTTLELKIQDNKDRTKDTTDSSYSVSVKDDKGEEKVSIERKESKKEPVVLDTKNEIDGFLIYDYFNSRNLILFRPKLYSETNSEIQIRRFDVFAQDEGHSGTETENSLDSYRESKSSATSELIAKKTISEKKITLTKNEARNNVLKNSSLLKKFGIDIQLEDYNRGFADYSVILNGTIYKYSEYKTVWETKENKYLNDAISLFDSNKNAASQFPTTSTKVPEIRHGVITRLINSISSFGKIDTRINYDPKENDAGFFVGQPESKKINLENETIKPFLEDFYNSFGKRIMGIYNQTCMTNSNTENAKMFFLQMYHSLQKTIEKNKNAQKDSKVFFGDLGDITAKRYYITLPELISDFVGKEEYDYSDPDETSELAKKFSSVLGTFFGGNRINELEFVINAHVLAETKIQPGQFLWDNFFVKDGDLAKFLETFDSESIMNLMYYYKKMAAWRFLTRLHSEFSSAKLTNNKDNVDPKYRSNFLETLFDVMIKDEDTSFDEFRIINTFRHAIENKDTSDTQYDKVGFDEKMFMEIAESKKEKMGLYIDDKIERNKVYQYFVSQKDSTVEKKTTGEAQKEAKETVNSAAGAIRGVF